MSAIALDDGELRRWTACAAVVLGLHAAVAGALLLTWREPITFGEPSNAIVVDLSPFTSAPSDSVDDITPGPRQQEAEQPPPAQQQVEKQEDQKIALPPTQAPSDAVLPPPTPVTPPAPVVVPPAPTTTAPPPAHVSQAQINAWYGDIATRLERHKSYPAAARDRGEQGVVRLAFSIDRQGRVLSSAIVAGSGYPALDEETMATLRRAQPFSAPPAGLGGDTFQFTLPVRFSIH